MVPARTQPSSRVWLWDCSREWDLGDMAPAA